MDSGYHRLGDVWSSFDGSNWTQVTDAAPWGPRYDHAVFVHADKIWVIGSARDVNADVWAFEEALGLRFTALPQGGWKEEGDPLTLTAGFEGAVGTVTYQWLKDGVEISGGTDATLNIASLAEADTGWYVCRVTDEAKAVYETPPVLIEVFAAGSLPVDAAWAIYAVLVASLAAGVFRLRRLHP